MREKMLEMHSLVFGSFNDMINTITFDGINRQALINAVRERLAMFLPKLPPFDLLVDVVKDSLMATQDVVPDDISNLPPELQKLVTFTREKLTEARPAHDDAVLQICEKHFTESDADTLIAFFKSNANQKLRANGLLDASMTSDEIDTIGTFLKSESGQKFRAVRIAVTNELTEATSKWRNEALEPHREEIAKILGFQEPAAADAPQPA